MTPLTRSDYPTVRLRMQTSDSISSRSDGPTWQETWRRNYRFCEEEHEHRKLGILQQDVRAERGLSNFCPEMIHANVNTGLWISG